MIIKLDKDFESFPSHIMANKYFTESVTSSANADISETKASGHSPAVLL